MCHGIIAYELSPLHRTYGRLMCPGARRLGAGAHNHPTVRTVGAVAPGAGFSCFILRVC
jgi:hypothetical protein